MALAGLLIFLIVLFSGVLFGPAEECLGRPDGDARSQFYSWRAYAFGEVREGRFPLWNPYEFLGMPFVASLQSGMFYPTNWLCAFLPIGLAANLGIVINLFLSGLFTYLWCRRLGVSWAGAAAAAATYTFGAPQFLRIFEGHWSFLCTMTWVPCLFLCVEMLLSRGKWVPAVAGGAVAVAMQLFGGNPQYALYGGVAAVLYFAVRLFQERRVRLRRTAKRIGGFAAIYVIGVVLAGVQLVPALEFLSLSSRQGQLSLAWISQYSLVPESLATLLVPDFFGSDVAAEYWGRWNLWEMSAYVGVVAVGLAFMSLVRFRRKLCLPAAGLALLMLLLALGKYTPLQGILYHTTPGFGLFRTWARFLCPFSLFVGLLAGMGLDVFLVRDANATDDDGSAGRGRSVSLRLGLCVLSGVAIIFVVAGFVLTPESASIRESWMRFMQRVLANVGPLGERLYLQQKTITPRFATVALQDAGMGLLRSGLLLGGLAAVLWMSLRMREKRIVLALALLALIAMDAWTFGRCYLQSFDPKDKGLTPGALKFLKKQNQPFRYARAGSFKFPAGEGMIHKLGSIEGIQPNVPARFRDIFWSLQSWAKDHQTTRYFLYAVTPPFRMLNLRYFVQHCDNPRMKMAGLRTVHEDKRFRIEELPAPWPRAWLVHSYAVIADQETLLNLLKRVNYEKQALLETEPYLRVSPPGRIEPPPRIVSYECNRVVIEADPAADALLILSDLHYPGWEVAVDGRSTPMLRANYCMRAVHLPAGTHTVEFRYRPRSFRIGIALSLAACAVLALMMGIHVGKKRKARKADTRIEDGA